MRNLKIDATEEPEEEDTLELDFPVHIAGAG